MLKLVLGNSLPFASVLSLQPIPDFRDLKERNGDRKEGTGKVDWPQAPNFFRAYLF